MLWQPIAARIRTKTSYLYAVPAVHSHENRPHFIAERSDRYGVFIPHAAILRYGQVERQLAGGLTLFGGLSASAISRNGRRNNTTRRFVFQPLSCSSVSRPPGSGLRPAN
jgi:hypothetical protein